MVQIMHSMSMIESPLSCLFPIKQVPFSFRKVSTCLYQCCGTFTSFSWEQFFIDVCQLIFTLASGISHAKSTIWDNSQSFFYEGWIAHFRVPQTVTTNRGTNFESKLFPSLTKYFGIQKTRTAAYNLKVNGMVERFHRQLKAA